MATSHLTNAQVATQKEKLANFTLFQLESMSKVEQLQKLASFIDVVAAEPSGDFRIGCFPQQVLHFDAAKKFLIDQLVWAHWLRANEILRRHRAMGYRNSDFWDTECSHLTCDYTRVITRIENGSTFAYLHAWNENWGSAGFGYKFQIPSWLYMGNDAMMDFIVLEFNLNRSEY